MATGKSSRSRSAVSSAKDNGPKLEEGLNPFKSDKFDAESYVQSNCSLNDKVLFIFLFILHTYSIIHVVWFSSFQTPAFSIAFVPFSTV